jgi:glycosyltransferase involved in cell wall biosynthesis
MQVSGLIQSGERVLGRGLPPSGGGAPSGITTDEKLNRFGRVVISVEQATRDWHLKATLHTVVMALNHMLGRHQRLSEFDASHFKDFMWRRFFERTLPPEDFDVVMKAAFRIARVPWNAMHICGLVTRRLGYAVYPRLDTSHFDVMVAETPFPASVSRSTRLVIRYHDAIPLLMPHTISDRRFHQAFHYRALRKNVTNGAWFACVSETTRKDLLSIFPEVETRTVTIHNTVSHHYFYEESSPQRLTDVIKRRLNNRIKPPLDPSIKRRLFDTPPPQEPLYYLLIVSTLEPRKNHLNLLTAWERLRSEQYPGLRIIAVGSLGWHHKAILRRFRPWLERGDLFLLEEVLAAELRFLYRHARATVCPSFGEGFDYSGVEAMKSGGAVVASDIPVHREIYGAAARYFNPYSVEDLMAAIHAVIDPQHQGYRNDLILKGVATADRYSNEAIVPKWSAFLSGDRVIAK